MLHAQLLMREEKHQEAVATLQGMLAKTPAYPGGKALLLRAEALLRGEDPDAAEPEEGDATNQGAADAVE